MFCQYFAVVKRLNKKAVSCVRARTEAKKKIRSVWWLPYFEVFVIIEEMKKINLCGKKAAALGAEEGIKKIRGLQFLLMTRRAEREAREKEAFSSREHKHFWLLPLIGMSCWPGP
jgi:hypothetical protein